MPSKSRTLKAVPSTGVRTKGRPEVQQALADGSASLATVEALVQSWSDNELSCRSRVFGGHRFRPVAVQENKKRRFFYISMQCTSCRTEKSFVMNYRGALVGKPTYHYRNANYVAPAGSGRIIGEGQNLLRLSAVRRLTTIQELPEGDDTPRGGSGGTRTKGPAPRNRRKPPRKKTGAH